MNLKKRDRDLEWLSALRDMENPGRIRQKQSSNMVFIGAVSLIGIVAVIYVQLMNQNLSITRQIKGHEDYIGNERNIDMYEWHKLLQERSAALVQYRDGADKFLDQLKMARRLSEEEFRYYETALKDSTSFRSLITGFATDYNTIMIKGVVPEESMPRQYAEYLTNQKDEEGNAKFASVQYNGFSQNGTSNYEFTVTILLWNQVK